MMMKILSMTLFAAIATSAIAKETQTVRGRVSSVLVQCTALSEDVRFADGSAVAAIYLTTTDTEKFAPHGTLELEKGFALEMIAADWGVFEHEITGRSVFFPSYLWNKTDQTKKEEGVVTELEVESFDLKLSTKSGTAEVSCYIVQN